MATYYDRYKDFKSNGSMLTIPFIPIPLGPNDKRLVYKLGLTRMDKLSQDHYNNPVHGYLIMSANPQFGGMEFDIPDGEIIIIPFPFKSALKRYQDGVNKHKRLYGE